MAEMNCTDYETANNTSCIKSRGTSERGVRLATICRSRQDRSRSVSQNQLHQISNLTAAITTIIQVIDYFPATNPSFPWWHLKIFRNEDVTEILSRSRLPRGSKISFGNCLNKKHTTSVECVWNVHRSPGTWFKKEIRLRIAWPKA